MPILDQFILTYFAQRYLTKFVKEPCYQCAGCGRYVPSAGVEVIETGTTLTCPVCRRLTIVHLVARETITGASHE